MKKCSLLIILMVLSVLLNACSFRAVDEENKNILAKETLNQLSGCDIYYNISKNMSEYLEIDSKSYTDIVYAAASVARSTWYEGDNKFYTVTDDALETDISFLNSSIHNASQYSPNYHSGLQAVLEKISPQKMSLIITDLQSDLYDYSKVSELFVRNVLSNGLSIGFIGVQLDIDANNARTFFIIAIADTDNLSKYINNFKENPTIIGYSGETYDFQMDVVKMINYQIIANKSGIQGIDYKNIQFVENGFYAGLDGNIDKQETEGSFSKLNREYTKEQMESVIEGTVNFTPNVQRFVNVRAKKGGTTPIYLGAKSLVYERKNSETGQEIAGKVKLQIPFNIISGVKLSKIQCDLQTKAYILSGGKPEECDVSDIKVVLADAATPEQGKWRVDDKTNSVILNIMMPNAGVLPIEGKEALKLDVKFKHNDTIESVSQWVRNWEDRGCNNIMNLFNSLYTYQKDANIAENTLTVYLSSGEKKITQRVERSASNRKNSEEKQ